MSLHTQSSYAYVIITAPTMVAFVFSDRMTSRKTVTAAARAGTVKEISPAISAWSSVQIGATSAVRPTSEAGLRIGQCTCGHVVGRLAIVPTKGRKAQ